MLTHFTFLLLSSQGRKTTDSQNNKRVEKMTITKAKSAVSSIAISSKIEFITPEEARKILSKNTNNRPLKIGTIRYYKQLIERGLWELNGESIKIAKDGTLLDGQHRLEAISQSNVGVQTFVIRGLEKDVFTSIDAGKSRNHGDYLSIAGHSGNVKVLAAAARIAMFFGNDGNFKVHGTKAQGKQRNKVSPYDIVIYVEKHKGLIESCDKVTSKMSNIVPTSIAVGCHYVFSMINVEKAEEFFHQLSTGEKLKLGSPVLALRNRLISLRGDGRAGEGHRRMLVYYLVHAWNAFMAGRELKEIKYKTDYEIKIDKFKEHVLSNW